MSGYTLGNHNFVRWEGPRPQLVKQHVRKFVKPGTSGLSAQLVGIHGDEFNVQLSSVYSNATQVLVAESALRSMIGGVYTLWYEGVNYTTTFQTQYLMDSLTVQSAKRHPLLVGPGYSYIGGWKIVSQVTLTPIYIGN